MKFVTSSSVFSHTSSLITSIRKNIPDKTKNKFFKSRAILISVLYIQVSPHDQTLKSVYLFCNAFNGVFLLTAEFTQLSTQVFKFNCESQLSDVEFQKFIFISAAKVVAV
ncbi:MAG: hypothetical protein Q8S84_06470 [bacterium]|nr:hypothetical protein [bacterium]MDP3381111.1 hypothetical protein [bacterium]